MHPGLLSEDTDQTDDSSRVQQKAGESRNALSWAVANERAARLRRRARTGCRIPTRFDESRKWNLVARLTNSSHPRVSCIERIPRRIVHRLPFPALVSPQPRRRISPQQVGVKINDALRQVANVRLGVASGSTFDR